MTHKIYTNLADSVIYAGFRSTHQYNLENANLERGWETLSNVCRTEFNSLMDKVLSQENNTVLYVTLNQICDNRYLLLENQSSNFEFLKKLIQAGKLKISTYPICPNSSTTHTLISYTEQLLVKCLKRLCRGDSSPDLVYISSLFSNLGESSDPDAAPIRGIRCLLGYCPTDITYDETSNLFSYTRTVQRNGIRTESLETCVLDDLWLSRKRNYGAYVGLKKYEQGIQLTANDFLSYGFPKDSPQSILMWIQNLFELHEIARRCNAYEMNANPEIRLVQVMTRILHEGNELDNRQRLLQILCKPPERCRIETRYRRNLLLCQSTS